jgi:hypothetical protein
MTPKVARQATPTSNPYMCYNCGKGVHIMKDYPQPKCTMDLKDIEEENDEDDESGKANA